MEKIAAFLDLVTFLALLAVLCAFVYLVSIAGGVAFGVFEPIYFPFIQEHTTTYCMDVVVASLVILVLGIVLTVIFAQVIPHLIIEILLIIFERY